jgi:hypothetical protein
VYVQVVEFGSGDHPLFLVERGAVAEVQFVQVTELVERG